MNNKGSQDSKSKFENLELILSDLHRQDDEIGKNMLIFSFNI